MEFSEKYLKLSHKKSKKCVQIAVEGFPIMEIARFNRVLRCNHDVTYISIPREILDEMDLHAGEVVFVKISKGKPAENF